MTAGQPRRLILEDLPFFRGPKPRVFGHRGAAGIAPENTLPSFLKAIEDGAAYIELDVHETRDGQIVVVHDSSVDRTTDGSGEVRDMDIEALKRLDAGYRFTVDGGGSFPYRGKGIRVPTLNEFFEACPAVPAVIEVKALSSDGIHTLLRQIEAAGAASRVLLASYDDGPMNALREAIGRQGLAVATSYSFGEIRALVDWWSRGGHGDPPILGQALQVPRAYQGLRLVTEKSVEAAHAMGLEVHVWTVNDPAEMRELLELGVDGIVTDFPERMRELVKSAQSGRP